MKPYKAIPQKKNGNLLRSLTADKTIVIKAGDKGYCGGMG